MENDLDIQGNCSQDKSPVSKNKSFLKKILIFFNQKEKSPEDIPSNWDLKVKERRLKTIAAKKIWEEKKRQEAIEQQQEYEAEAINPLEDKTSELDGIIESSEEI